MIRKFFIFSINLLNILASEKSLDHSHILTFQKPSEENIYFRNLNSNNSKKKDKKNLIIGLIKGYNWSIIKPFFISLISANIKNYDLVMFVDNISEETLNKIKLCGTIIREIPEKNLGYQDLVKYRWKLYSDYLKENKDKYNQVFVCDARDVIFQKDIFQYYENNKSFIGFTLEDASLRNPVNKGWVMFFCKNYHEYKKIADKRIICGGTIISSVDKFIEFSEVLWQTISNLTNFFVQGAINYLIYYKKLLNDSLILTDNSGPIMTICITKRKKITLDSENNVLNFKGEIAAIVHQYDRKPDITRKMNKKYSDDILNKYLELKKINEAKKINEEYKAKMKLKKRIKIIRKTILISFIIFSIIIFTFIKSRNSGICKRRKKAKKHRISKIKNKYIRKKKVNYILSTSKNRII